MKVLIVDDDEDIRKCIKIYLTDEGYEIVEAEDGLQALELADHSIDLILMDVMMPKMNGIDACLKIREQYKMPILFLTAKSEDGDKLTGFTTGGDDYIVKPFNPLDLIIRVKAHLRRYKNYNTPILENKDEITIGDIVLNSGFHTMTKKGVPIKLTKKEFAILSLFFRNRQRVYSLEQIYENVWGEACILNAESTVSVHIRNLREKIEDDMSDPQYIKTVWGVGYRVE